MEEHELEQVLKDLSQDIDGLENIIERLKQRQVNSWNVKFQKDDLSSVSILLHQLKNTITELNKLLIGG